MNVLNYLEAISLPLKESTEYGIWLRRNFKFEGSYTEFYSQQFYPKLIMKLFKGFDDENIEGQIWNSVGTYFQFNKILKTNHYWIHREDHKPDHIENPPIPRTLDDFINDCQRAGIILNWRIK